MFNLGSLPTLVLVYPLWGLATPLLLAGIGGGLLGTILASVGLLRGRAPWYSALKYLLILLASFAIWQTGSDFVSPWNEGPRARVNYLRRVCTANCRLGPLPGTPLAHQSVAQHQWRAARRSAPRVVGL